jgi:transcriptional regulator with XRE-family HTH domain
MRERKGISQAELARLMNERGRPWHQATVYRAETGSQPMTLSEIEDLAAIFGSTVMAFTWDPAEITESRMVYDAGTRVKRAADEVAKAVFYLMVARSRAGRTIIQHRRSKWDRVQDAIEDVKDRLRTYPLDAAVWDGIRKYDERNAPEGGEG